MKNSQFAGIALASALALLAGCDSASSGTCSLNFAGEVNAAFGDVKLDSLLEASARFGVAAKDVDTRLHAACDDIIADLGGTGGMTTAESCDNAAAAITAAIDANSGVVLTVEYIAPVCSGSASAIVDCTGACDASFDASATPPTCEGGMLSGGCSGSCSGECTVEGSVSCTGSCSGSCSGSCDATVAATCTGTCNGACDGTCDSMDGNGNCNGNCTGTCRGTCTGTIEGSCSGSCSGMCSGSCRADVSGSCTGSCSGSCDVAFEEPTCEGGELNVDADVDCKAACEADASFDLECTDAQIVVTFTGTPADATALTALIGTIEDNLPVILEVAERAAAMAEATVTFATRLGGATSAAASAGLEAADCLRIAVQTQVAAAASISVSVEASVSVSGSVSGSSN